MNVVYVNFDRPAKTNVFTITDRWDETKLAEEFWKRVDRAESDECWEWKGGRHIRDGRGMMSCGRRGARQYAPRVSFLIHNGFLPPVVRHKCDNPPCVNPDHLEAGTVQDNVRDMWARGRATQGQFNSNKKECKQGHPFDEQNTKWVVRKSNGRMRRMCKTCLRNSSTSYRNRQMAVAA